ncbi:Zinc finger protein 862, partial [Dissostichus eleginoides]
CWGEEIKMEIKKAPFVAVMVDETTDVGYVAQLSFVLRYVTDTGVKERFVRFEDVTSGKRADDIAALIFRFLEEVNEFCDTIERERCQFSQIYEDTARISSGPSARRGPQRSDWRHTGSSLGGVTRGLAK